MQFLEKLDKELQQRFSDCCQEIIVSIKKHLPEVKRGWDFRDPNSFEERVYATMCLELVHAGMFKNE